MADMLTTMAEGPAPWHSFEDQVEVARQRFAVLINAHVDQIALLPTATIAAYQVVSGIDWSLRSAIIGTVEDFPSISQLFTAQRTRGVELRFVADPLSVQSWDDELGAHTGMVSIPLATYRHGALTPAAEVCSHARAKGVLSFVDAYQGAGVVPIDVQELDCDYLVAGASKYLLGLPGVAFLYCKQPAAVALQPELTGWMARDAQENFDPRSTTVVSSARRYEIGTPAIPAVLAVSAGLKLLNEIGVEAVYEHVSRLRDRLVTGAQRLGLTTVGIRPTQPHGAHVAFAVPDPQHTAEQLGAQGISVSPRGDLVRVAIHLYNTEEDIDRVLLALQGASARQSAKRPVAAAEQLHRTAVDELDSWCRQPVAARFPYQQVRSAYLRVGKHHVATELLDALARARVAAAGAQGDPEDRELLRAYFDIALDKADDRYDYPSYTGLSLLPMPNTEGGCDAAYADAAQVQWDRWLCWLMSDLLDFEVGVRKGEIELLPQLRPDDRIVAKRLHLGLRIMAPPLGRLGYDAATQPASAETDEARVEELHGLLAPCLSEDSRLRLQLCMMPVYTAHDEYLFIRVLQMFEITFAAMAVQLDNATSAIVRGDLATVEARMACAGRLLDEAAPLFSLLATMQVESFRTFRTFTEGASAIQSRGYKMVESLCREPDAERLDSAAYLSVPEIRAAILSGRLTIEEAYRQLYLAGDLAPAQQEQLDRAIARLGAKVMRWKRTHYSIALRMLGTEQTGTGYTEGTPYLAAVNAIPIFRSAGSRDATPIASRNAGD